MMKRIIFPVFLVMLYQAMLAQPGKIQPCSNGKIVISALPASTGETIFTAFYADKNTTDTMLISSASVPNPEGECFCNDSLATFLINDAASPLLMTFVYINGKWRFNDVLLLPPKFPLVGVLIDDRKYERYNHRLISPTELVSDLTILTAKKQKLVPQEQYTIEYQITMKLAQSQPGMIRTYDCDLVIIRKTLRDK